MRTQKSYFKTHVYHIFVYLNITYWRKIRNIYQSGKWNKHFRQRTQVGRRKGWLTEVVKKNILEVYSVKRIFLRFLVAFRTLSHVTQADTSYNNVHCAQDRHVSLRKCIFLYFPSPLKIIRLQNYLSLLTFIVITLVFVCTYCLFLKGPVPY